VERNESAREELLVLVLEGKRKTINDRSQDFEEFCNTIVALGLVDKPIEHVGDRLADERTVWHEFAVDTVQDRLQVVAFPRILRVKQFQESSDEVCIDVFARDFGLC